MVEPVTLPILVDAIQQNLPTAQVLHRNRELVRPDVPAFAPALHRALEPHVFLAVRPRPRRLDAPIMMKEKARRPRQTN